MIDLTPTFTNLPTNVTFFDLEENFSIFQASSTSTFTYGGYFAHCNSSQQIAYTSLQTNFNLYTFSVSLWFRPHQKSSNPQTIFSFEESNGYYTMNYSASDRSVGVYIKTSSVYIPISASEIITIGTYETTLLKLIVYTIAKMLGIMFFLTPSLTLPEKPNSIIFSL